MTRVEFVKLTSLHNARTTQNATVAVSSEVNALNPWTGLHTNYVLGLEICHLNSSSILSLPFLLSI